MVQVGFFTLELVRAETNQWCNEEFAEHTDSHGNVYVEVEPEEEYYLRLSSDVTETVYVDIYIDGEKIEEGRELDAKSQVTAGIYARSKSNRLRRDAIIETAFKFEKAPVYSAAEIQNDLPYWTGKVEVVFFGNPECMNAREKKSKRLKTSTIKINSSARENSNPESINTREKKRKRPKTSSVKIHYSARENCLFNIDRSSTAKVGSVRGSISIEHQKGLLTQAGTTILSQTFLQAPSKQRTIPTMPKCTREPRRQITHEPQRLGSISVQYCSTVGLIHCKILPKPEYWKGYLERLKYLGLERTDDWKTLSDAKCVKKEIFNGRIDNTGKVSSQTSTVDFFDLSRED